MLPGRARCAVSRATAIALLVTGTTVAVTVAAPSASASGTVLFSQPFHDNTVDGPAGSVSLPASPTGTNSACLTAAGNPTANPLASCPSTPDTQGSGTLRLTSAATTQEGGIFSSSSVPTSQGLDVTFNSYQYGGTGADGIAFVLAATDPANPQTPTTMGQSGGALGYSAKNSTTPGLTDGYLGVGLDTYGNYSNNYEGTGCTNPPNINQAMPGEVVVRGPGNGTVGYCPLLSSAATATSQKLILRATTRAASLVPVEVVFNPSSLAVTTPSGLVVPGGDYDVTFTPVGGPQQSLVNPLPTVPAGLYPASWLNSSGIPKQLTFGWVASTGASTDFHEISNVLVSSLNPVPKLAVSQTSYAAATLSPGSPVTYVVAASSSGAPENSPVTVIETMPAGVLPVSASGPGWVCGAPSGQQISCTDSTSPFTSGTITVNGVVTSSSVTPAVIQASSTVVASSGDANPATSSSAPAGILPAAPVVTGVTPASGAAGGGNDVTVTGTGLSGATAIEIGTAAQFTAGTPVTLALCATSAPGCFTVTSSTSLDISSMPAHAAGSVTVKVVSLGVAGSGSYTFNPGPALNFAAPPAGEINTPYSDQLTVTGGTSPITWSVSTGTLPPGITLSPSTGLLSGTPTAAGAYSFTVMVTDSSGLTATEPVTLTIISGPSLSFPAPPPGWTHTVYGDTLTESGGTGPFAWSVSSGSLPAGISLSPDGNLSGTPTATGTFAFTIKVTDANGQAATQATSITVSAGVSTTFPAPPPGDVGGAYSDTLTATGGTTPYTWSVNAGTLPPGLTLSSAGVLAGTPTTAGSYTFTVNVIDANKGIATTSITLVVSSGLAISSAAPPNTDVGIAYSDALTATGGTTPYTWSVSAGSLPAGVTLNASTGVLAGTATTAGTSSFTIKVTDAIGQSATQAATIVVAARPSLAFPAPPPGQASVAYSDTLTVTGGTGPFAWSVSAGSLPAGLSLNPSTGVLSGTPATAGSFPFTVQVSDAFGATATEAVTLVIATGPLVIAATASPSPAVPGGTVHFTVTVTNTGLSTYTGATFTDPLAGVLDDASYNGDATATAGSLSYTSPNLTWTGNLAPGAAATVTFSVTVNNPDTGNKILAATITSTTAGSNCASGSTDARCTVSVPVSILTISATPSTTSATPGTTVSYTIAVTNAGQSAYTGATFTDPLSGLLGNAAYNGDATATSGSLSYTSPNLTWTGSLAPGATATITFSATVSNPDTGNKVLVTAVTSPTAGSNCPASGPAPACGTSVTVLVPTLTIVNSAGVASATPGSVVRYTVTITNSGQMPYAGISVADSLAGLLDDAAYDGDAAASSGTVSYASPNLTWTGSLAVGAAATVTFSATVNTHDTGDKVLATTVTSAAVGSNCAAGSTDARCSTSVPVLIPGLTLAASANTASTTAGSTVQYTVTASNTGQTTDTGVSFTESLVGVLDDAAYNGDAAATSGSVSYASPNLTWTGTLTPGATVTVTYSVTVNNPDTGDKILSSTVTSAAAGSNCPPGGTSPSCSSTVTVASLEITSLANVATTTPGGVVRYTATFTNTGQAPYTGITITSDISDVLANATPNGDQTATSGTLTLTSTGISWTGSIPVGGTVTVTGTVTVNNPDTGSKVMTSTLATSAPGSNCPAGGTDPACTATVTVLVPGLTIAQAANVPATTPGSVVQFTVTITDSGQTPYTGTSAIVSLSGALDDAAYDGDAVATTGSLSYAAPVLTWTGSLSPGGTATITYSVTVNNPDNGDKLLVTTASSVAAGSSCPPGTTSAPCQLTVPVLTPALTITSSANVPTTVPGGTVQYTVTIANTGQTPYTGATVADSLPGVLDDAAYNGDAAATTGTVSFANPSLMWTGSLAPGATATVTFSVTVHNPDTGDKILSSTVTSAAAGSNCATGSTDPRCTTTVTVSQLTIDSTFNPVTVTPGGTVNATTTITNTGQTPYHGISVDFTTANTAAQISDVGNEAASSGTLSVGTTGAVWTGDVPVGATVTITGSLMVANPYPTGSQVISLTAVTTAAGSNCPAGSTDPRCTATANVVIPGLTIAQAASVPAATPGSSVQFTVTVTNTGQTSYTGAAVAVSLAGMLDDGIYHGDAAVTTGSLSYAAPVLTWTGSLSPGGTAVITYSVTVNDPDTGDKLLVTAASSAAAGSSCPPGTTSAPCQLTIPVLTPALTIVQAAATTSGSDAVATPGGVVSYTITVANTGQVPYTGATLTDPLAGVLDDATYDGDAAATAGTVTFASPNLTWTGDLSPGAAAVITFTVTVNNPDTGDRSLASTVTSPAAGSNCPAGGTDARCAVTVTVVGASTLTFTQTAAAGTAVPGGSVHYTITIANSGASPYDGASLADPLDGVLDDAAYDNDAVASAGTVSFASPTLSWAGNVPASGTVTITYSVTVDNPDTGNMILSSTITSPSAGGNCPAASPGPRCTATVTVAQLAIDSAFSTATATPGTVVDETTTIANTGQAPYYGISVDFTTANTAAQISDVGNEAASSGTLSVGTTGAVWTGDVPVGGTVTITGSVIIASPYPPGSQVIAITDATTAAGSNCPAGSTDPRCTATLNVVIPGLTIVKTASTSVAEPGTVVDYTVTVTDSGQTPYSGAVVTDDLTRVLGDAAYNGDAAATSGSVSYAAPDLTWTGSLSPGGTATITYTVTVDNPDKGGKLLVNTVSSAAAGSSCPPGTTSASCQATTAVLTPGLTISNAASTSTTTPGATVGYTVTVTDTGQTPYTGVTVADDLSGVLDDAAYNGDASATAGTVSYASPVLTWTGSLSPGGSVTVTFTVTVHNPDAGNKVLSAAVTSPTAGSNCAAGSTDPACTTTVLVTQLAIDSAFSTATATPGTVVDETTTIANTGQAPYYGISVDFTTANTAAQISDVGNEAASSGTLSVGTTGAVWTGDVPVGGTVTITGSVIIASPYPPGSQVIAITDATTAAGSNCPAGSTDPRCTATLNVVIPGLTITNTPGTSAAVPGATVGYTVSIADTGQTSYSGVAVADDLSGLLDDAAYDGDASATAGLVSYASPVLTWTGDLSPGDSVTVTFTVTVHNPDAGDKQLVTVTTSGAAGSSCPPGTTAAGCRSLVAVLTPALAITNAASTSTTTPGATVGYTVTITDAGQTSYTGVTVADDLSGVLDDAAYNGDASATAGTVSYASPALTWTGSLSPGDTATVTFTVTVHNPDTGNKVLTTLITSAAAGSDCAAGSTDPACATSVPVAVVAIVNSASAPTVTPGGVVGYTVTVTNSGQVPVASGTLAIPLADVLDDAAYDGDAAATAGTVSFTSPDLTWTGDLGPGQSATITFSVTVSHPDTGNKVLTDTVTSAMPGSTCPASGPAPAACSTSVTVLIPALTITQAANVATTTPGSVVQYTITVADTGQTSYAGATVTDDLSNVLYDAAYNADAAATAGTVSYASPVLTWTGDLSPGGTAIITFSVTVSNPDTGDKHLVNTVVSTAPGSTCPPAAPAPACTTAVTDLIPALTITKTANVASATPGSAVQYTITVADTGQTTYSPATVTDSLSGVLGDAAYDGDATATSGTVSYASPVLTWTGALAPGATATITYSVTVDSPDTGGRVLSNAAASADPDSTCPAGRAGPPCGVTIPVIGGALTITAPANSNLGAASPGATFSGDLGTVQVTDDRGFGAGWTVTVSGTSFVTGGGTPAETIPASDAFYDISALTQASGAASLSYTPATNLGAPPRSVVTATNVVGNTTVTWDPAIQVQIPADAVGGTYTATITHSVS